MAMQGNSGNLLLDALPPAVRRPCLEAGEAVEMRVGEQIVTQGERTHYAFFPASAVCSLTMGLRSGDKAECASVGAEGVIGVSLLAGASRSPFSAIVQVAGAGYRVPLPRIGELLQDSAPFRDAVFVYSGYALNVVGRSVACNSYHSIAERLARWLLMTQDRTEREELALTHDLLSQMLAATRPRVSLAAGKLRTLRTIDYQRGVIRILDRKRLEQVACECYDATRRYMQMLPWIAR
ncbi:MAG TPA: Crp/Fnr family transcriptional regulator [Burkholderiales bacterium]|nr:Crp/Fnr family transcriptional regulator [Burkholderiales bacterium]